MKKLILSILCFSILNAPVCAKAKLQKGLDTYFKVTGMLNLTLKQQRKAFGVKLEEMYHLAPLIEQIKQNEELLPTLKGEEKEEMEKLLQEQKALAREKKRYYISRYRSILDEEQTHLLDELIFDVANGYLKL